MNKQSLRDMKREATAQSMAEAAYQLAIERGMDGFVVEDIVQRAGYSRRTFANHFTCKEEAVTMAAIPLIGDEEVEALLGALPESSSPLEVLRNLMRAQFTTELFRKLRELISLSNQYPSLEPYILSMFRRLQLEAEATFSKMFDGRYPEGYTQLLIGAVYGAIMPIIDGRMKVTLPGDKALAASDTAAFEQYLDMAFGYLQNGF